MAITVVGLVDTERDAESVVRDLTNACHCARDEISLTTIRGRNGAPAHQGGVATGAMKGLVGGAILGAIAGFVVGSASISVPGFEGVLARGPAATIIVGAVLFAVVGAIIGALAGIERRSGEDFDEGSVRRAGTLITVHTLDEQDADCAVNILRRHGAREIDKRSSDWNRRDWGEHAAAQEPSLRPVPDRPAAPEAAPRMYNKPMEEAAAATPHIAPVAQPAAPPPPQPAAQPTMQSTDGWITRKYTATYFGPERRKAANQAPYQGAERRHSA